MGVPAVLAGGLCVCLRGCACACVYVNALARAIFGARANKDLKVTNNQTTAGGCGQARSSSSSSSTSSRRARAAGRGTRGYSLVPEASGPGWRFGYSRVLAGVPPSLAEAEQEGAGRGAQAHARGRDRVDLEAAGTHMVL